MKSENFGISAIVIIYNEEKILERCLLSLVGVVDEIIVIHDGECMDNSLSIARKYTDKIYLESHKGEAELHQISALEYATFSWILKIDADEYLSEDLRKNIKALIKDSEYDLYAFIWPIWDGTTYITQKVPFKDALFRKEKIFAVEFPHKTYSSHGVRKNVPFLLEHRPKYNNYTLDTFKRKWGRWSKLQAEYTLHHQDLRFYNYSAQQIARYHKYMEKMIRYAHPILTPAWFTLSFIKFFFRLKGWKHVRSIKLAVLQGMYAALLCYYLWDGKRKNE